jgi:hypothetical protein
LACKQSVRTCSANVYGRRRHAKTLSRTCPIQNCQTSLAVDAYTP